MHLMEDPTTTHIYALFLFLSIMILNLYFVLTQKNFMVLAKRLKLMTPLYHLTNAIVIYTGAIIAAYFQMFSLKIALMIAVSIFLMVLEIKRYKKQRVIKSTNTQLQEQFYIFAKKVYTAEITVLITAYLLFKVI